MSDDAECPKKALEEKCKPACAKYALAYEVGVPVGCGACVRRCGRFTRCPLTLLPQVPAA